MQRSSLAARSSLSAGWNAPRSNGAREARRWGGGEQPGRIAAGVQRATRYPADSDEHRDRCDLLFHDRTRGIPGPAALRRTITAGPVRHSAFLLVKDCPDVTAGWLGWG